MSKAARAVEIYQEEAQLGADSLRKRCIARFKSELSMGDAGAGTYFQNTKKKLEGANGNTPQLQLSIKAAPKTTVAAGAPPLQDEAKWCRYETDQNGIVEVVEYYETQTEQLAALEEKGGKATLGMDVINIGDCYK